MTKRSKKSGRAITVITPPRQRPTDFEDRGFTLARYYLGRIDRAGRHQIRQLITERVSLGELLIFLFREIAQMDPIETASMLKLSSQRVNELERSARRRLATIERRAEHDSTLSALVTEKPARRIA